MAKDMYVPVFRYDGSRVHVAGAFHRVLGEKRKGDLPVENIGGGDDDSGHTLGLVIPPGPDETGHMFGLAPIPPGEPEPGHTEGVAPGPGGDLANPVVGPEWQPIDLRPIASELIGGHVVAGVSGVGDPVMFIADDYQLEHVVRELGHAIVDAQREVWLVTPEPK